MRSALLFYLLIALYFTSCFCKIIYNTKKSYIIPITRLNFDSQVSKIRQTTKMITIVQYYKYNGFKIQKSI